MLLHMTVPLAVFAPPLHWRGNSATNANGESVVSGDCTKVRRGTQATRAHLAPVTALRLTASREIEYVLHGSHQKGKRMIMIVKTPGSQVDSPVAEGNRKEGGVRKMRDLHKDT